MGIFQEQARDKSDWTDQDLLTLDEALERLREQEAELEDAVAGGDAGEPTERRLAAVRHLIQDITGRMDARA